MSRTPSLSHASQGVKPQCDLGSRKRADRAPAVVDHQPPAAGATSFKPIGAFVADVLAKARPQ